MAAGDAVTMYETNELDMTPVGTGDLPRIQDPQSGLSDQLTITQQLATFYIGLNCQVAPFNDIKVRQAFAQALDRQRIVDTIYDKTVPAATTIVPPQMPGYSTSGLQRPGLRRGRGQAAARFLELWQCRQAAADHAAH